MRRLALLILIWTFAPLGETSAESGFFYDPGSQRMAMSVPEAEAIAIKGLRNMWAYTDDKRGDKIVDVRVDIDRGSLTLVAGKDKVAKTYVLGTVDPRVFRRDKMMLDEFIVGGVAVVLQDSTGKPTPNYKVEPGFLKDDKKSSNPTLAQVSHALLVLKEAAATRTVEVAEAADEARFRSAVLQYRQSKPMVPENARRLVVQAEAAIDEKQFAEANELLRQAAAIAPWWPEVHFNLAQGLASASRFREAITEMRRYLILMPEAADARDAQDVIYVWERKLRK